MVVGTTIRLRYRIRFSREELPSPSYLPTLADFASGSGEPSLSASSWNLGLEILPEVPLQAVNLINQSYD